MLIDFAVLVSDTPNHLYRFRAPTEQDVHLLVAQMVADLSLPLNKTWNTAPAVTWRVFELTPRDQSLISSGIP